MVKCEDCKIYKPIANKPGYGLCYGVELKGDTDPMNISECKGKYFKPRE